jgi:F420-0:gamma-glutamyl ligase
MVDGKEPVAWVGRRAVVAFPEHVDMSNAAQTREQLRAVFDRGAAVVIADMSATRWPRPASMRRSAKPSCGW